MGPYTTTMGSYGGSTPITVTLPPSGIDTIGTIIVETPSMTSPAFAGSYITVIGGYGGSTPVTVTLQPTGIGSIGTVYV